MEHKILLRESEIPRQWYNLAADLPTPPLPPLGPNGKPITPDMLAPVFPMNLIEQEASTQRWIDIPEPILDILYRWRPAPLRRAVYLEKHLKTPARIYYKDESLSPAGSHKPNTAVAQAYYNKVAGITRLTTETGAGQWGCALAFACALLGLECKVYMVRISFDQKPFRKLMMQVWGANCVASPSTETNAGRTILAEMPDTPGSLGIAISEALEDTVTHPGTKYSLGSVVNHVLLHQTVIGLETKQQMEIAGEYPDILIGCVGGGSNFGGLVLPFVKDKIDKSHPNLRVIAVESMAAPSMTKGVYAYDWGDTAKMGPVAKMHTLGHGYVPAPVHAGGLRYHGVSPILSTLLEEKLIESRACHQLGVFEAAISFARAEGFVMAPETAHAIRATMDEALACKESGESKVIVFGASGHGHFDLAAYDAYLGGKLQDYEYPAEKVQEALKDLPKVK